MNNPGAIILAAIKTNVGEFRVEDNIGEGIHLHMGEIRIEISIDEFINVAEEIEKTVKVLLENVSGFSLDKISKKFFCQNSALWKDLLEVKSEKVYLNDLLVITEKKKNKKIIVELGNSDIVKELYDKNNIRKKEKICYSQMNEEKDSNILKNIESFECFGNDELIVVFNDQNIIIDGKNRAAHLFFLKGNIEVEIQRMIFKEYLHSLNINTKKISLDKIFMRYIARIKEGYKKKG